jgi:hypothetical protein
MAVIRFEIWPYPIVHRMYNMYLSLITFGEVAPENRIFRAPPQAARTRFAFHRPALQLDGYYAFLGWDDGKHNYTAWLYDRKGQLLHEWVVD